MATRTSRFTAAAVALGAALLMGAPVTHADPGDCGPAEAGALTWPDGAPAPLRCDGVRWRQVDDPYPVSDHWVSLGPEMSLRGGARQNPVILPGHWIATPLDPDDACSARQVSVTYGVVDGPPRVDQGAPGQPLSFEVIPRLLTIDLGGRCSWQKVSD